MESLNVSPRTGFQESACFMELSGACLERDRGDDPLGGPWYVRLIRRVTPVMENAITPTIPMPRKGLRLEC